MACAACGKRRPSRALNTNPTKVVGGYPAGAAPTQTRESVQVAPQPSQAEPSVDTRGPLLAATGQEISMVTGSAKPTEETTK